MSEAASLYCALWMHCLVSPSSGLVDNQLVIVYSNDDTIIQSLLTKHLLPVLLLDLAKLNLRLSEASLKLCSSSERQMQHVFSMLGEDRNSRGVSGVSSARSFQFRH